MTEIMPLTFTGLPAGSLGRSNGGILNPGSRYKKSRFHSQSHAILIKPPAADLSGFESEIYSNKRQSAKADCPSVVGGILNPGSRYKKSRFHSQSYAILIKPPAADLSGFESEIYSNKRQSAKADCLLLVEMVGFEPMTSALRTQRSPN